jgi:hypothetical protein
MQRKLRPHVTGILETVTVDRIVVLLDCDLVCRVNIRKP